MANVAASLTILVGFGAALALTGPGDDVETRGSAETRGVDQLEAGTAIRISAAAPAQALGPKLGRGDPTLHPEVSAALRHTWSAVERAGVDPSRDLLAHFSFLTLSVERSCPPPALLSCRPATRLRGRLDGDPPPGLQRSLSAALVSGLRAAGYRPLAVPGSGSGKLSGRVSSDGETLARWRRTGDVIEVVAGGLELRTNTAKRSNEASADLGRHISATPKLRIETNPDTLAALLR